MHALKKSKSHKHPAQTADLLKLPKDVLHTIFRFLSVSDLGNIAITCFLLDLTASDNSVWKIKIKEKDLLPDPKSQQCMKQQYKLLIKQKELNPHILFKTRSQLILKSVFLGDVNYKKSQKNAKGIFLVFNYEDRDSFLNIMQGCEEIQKSQSEKTQKSQFWDTSRQERSQVILHTYLKNADGIFLVFNHEDRDSFFNIMRWYKKYQQFLTANTLKELIGISQNSTNSAVDENEIKTLTEKLNIPYQCINTETRRGIDQIFQMMIKRVLKTHTESQESIETEEKSIPKTKSKEGCTMM